MPPRKDFETESFARSEGQPSPTDHRPHASGSHAAADRQPPSVSVEAPRPAPISAASSPGKARRPRSPELQEAFERILMAAYDRYTTRPDWSVFFCEILGVDGLVRQSFRRHEDLVEFERSEFFPEIQFMLRRLREDVPPNEEEVEPTQVITLRVPESLQRVLRQEAFEHGTSMNKLCISKLLQHVEEASVPSEVVFQAASRAARRHRKREGGGDSGASS